MLNKLFSVEEDFCHYKIKILGIKFKIRSLKLTVRNLINVHETKRVIPSSRAFLFTNLEKLSEEQKIWYLSQRFYEECGYFPNFKNPKSFNEKLNWMKLNYYNPNESRAIDKYEFKNYIKEKLGEGYTIPLIGVYNDVNDIDFDSLPNEFVIKMTANGSLAGVKIVKDKTKLDIDLLKYKFNNQLQDWNTVYYSCLSRGYKDIKPRIIVEKYIEDVNGQLNDYKIFCFHGKAKFIYVAVDHFPGKVSKISLFDLSWKKLPVNYGDHHQINRTIDKPENLDEMIKLAEKLAQDFPFVRVDFYNVNNKIYIGELTFTPGGGFGKYSPVEWDYKMGEWLDLNKIEGAFKNV